MFADRPENWIRHAISFSHTAELIMRGIERGVEKRENFLSTTQDQYLEYSAYRQACYFQAHVIELCMKGIYCLLKTPHDKPSESISHNIRDALDKSIIKNFLPLNKLIGYDKTIELADMLLKWAGRYYKPLEKDLRNKYIDELLEVHPTKNFLVRIKHSLTPTSYAELSAFANILFEAFYRQRPIFPDDQDTWFRGFF